MTRNLQRVAKFVADSNGAFSEGGVRWLIHKSGENGLAAAGAIVRVGRTVLIDVDAFDRWLTAQNSQRVAA